MNIEKIIEDYNSTKPEKFNSIHHKNIFVNELCKDHGVGTVSKIGAIQFPFHYSKETAIFLHLETWIPQLWSSSAKNDIFIYNKLGAKKAKAIAQIIQPDFKNKGLFVQILLGEIEAGDIIFFRPY